jgi:predicted RNA-binding Zn-ribbon protein involved in translation (DUF1610 family)
MKAKILHLDIENMFLEGAIWSLWKQNIGIDSITAEWYILSYAAMWDDSDDVLYDSLPRHKESYAEDPENDYCLLLSLRDLLDEADIVVAHNGKAFDVKKINARFLKHGIPPCSPFRIVDTLLVARKHFNLPSNKLDYLARLLGVGKKNDTGGIDLWKDCKKGVKKAWKEMVEYNIQDVILLRKVYKKLLPWIDDHPNVNIYKLGDAPACPKCGSEDLQRRGSHATNVGLFQRFRCNDCGGWTRSRYSELSVDQRKRLLANAASNN